MSETDFGDIDVYHQGGHRYLVVNSDTERLYKVDLEGPTCGCEDFEYNKDDTRGDACKHIRKVVAVGPSQQTMEVQAFGSITDAWSDIRQAVNDIKDVRDVAQAAQNANAAAAVDRPESDAETPPSEPDIDAEGIAAELQDAYDGLIDDMTVKASDGIIWVQTGQDTPEEWPFPGGDETWNVLLKNPEQVQYVGEGGDEYDAHEYYDLKPGKWWKNAIDPEDVEAYIEEVLE